MNNRMIRHQAITQIHQAQIQAQRYAIIIAAMVADRPEGYRLLEDDFRKHEKALREKHKQLRFTIETGCIKIELTQGQE